VRAAWERFWFESQAPAQVRLFRSLVGVTLFGFHLALSFDLPLFYSDAGLLPLSVLKEVVPAHAGPSLLFWFQGAAFLWACHVTFLASTLLLALGFAPRAAAIVAFVLHLSFLHRDPAAAYGADRIANFFLLYLCLMGSRTPSLQSVGYRLCQLQVCIVYGYSGLEKLKGAHWWRGEAIWDVLANAQLARYDFSFVAAVPLLIVGATYLTLLFEIYFPALVWVPRLRYPLLALGVALHLGMALALDIAFFAALMIASYALFLDDGLSVRIESRLPRPWRR